MAPTPEQFQRLCAAFEAALELPAESRAEHVESAFPDEEQLRDELRRMLDGHDTDSAFLQAPSAATLPAARERAAFLEPGDRVGDFELVRLLGSGGMGLVFEATQLEPRRTVALKTMRAGLGAGMDARRLREEARVLARLSHPGIAQILAAGVLEDHASGVPWFAMEFVGGARSLDAWAEGEELAVPDRLRLFLQVCDAVSHGHLRGVVHRDLKPDNLLVGDDGRVKVIDFGIARVREADDQRLTVDGAVMGTLPYMAPEQIEGDREAIDVRTDVHALGAVLFQLLSGRPPWPQGDATFGALARRILEDEAPRLSSVKPGLSRELDWIVATALAKEPARRYQSAAELGADVQRLLDHQPLAAGPPSTAYRARKFVRRHTTLVAAFVLLVLGAGGTAYGLLRALDKQAEAEAARTEVEQTAARALAQNRYLEEMLGAADPFGLLVAGRELTVAQMLDDASERIGGAFPEQPDSEAAVRLLIGSTYRAQGRNADAAEHLEVGLRMYRELRRGPHADVARALRLLGALRSTEGDHDEALRLLEQSLDMLRTLGVRDQARVRTHSALSIAFLRARRVEDAEAHARAALEHQLDLHPGQSEAGAILTMNLARVLRARGDAEGAERAYRDCVIQFEELLTSDHPNVGLAKNNLGFLLHDQGRSAEALPLLQEAVAGLRHALPDPHSKFADACVNLSNAFAATGHLEESIRAGREAIAVYDRALGDEHPDYANAVNSLAYVLCESERWIEAEVEFRVLVDFFQRTGGEEHPRVCLNRAYAAECVGYRDLETAVAELEGLYAAREVAAGAGDAVAQAVVRCVVRLYERAGDEAGLRAWQQRLTGQR